MFGLDLSRHRLASTVNRSRVAGGLAVVGATVFAVAVVVQPVYRTDRAFSDPFSQYALGPYGCVQTAAFVALSGAAFALVAGLSASSKATNGWRTGRTFLAAFATGVFVAAIFPIEGTVSAPIHMVASMLSFLAIVAAMLMLSRVFAHEDRWCRFSRTSSAIATACAVTLVLATATQHTPLFGVWQRTFLGMIVLWVVAVGVWLRRTAS